MTSPRRLPATGAIVLALLIAIACGGSDGGSNPTQPTPPLTTLETFTGTIAQGQFASHPIMLLSAGDVTVEIVDLEPLGSLGFFFGAPNGNICVAQIQVGTVTETTVLVQPASAGDLCIQVFDPGTIQAGAPITYVINVRHP